MNFNGVFETKLMTIARKQDLKSLSYVFGIKETRRECTEDCMKVGESKAGIV